MMTLTDILYTSIATVPGVVVFVELFRLMPVTACLKTLAADSNKAMSIVRSKKISDHWKEKVLPTYSGKIFRSSLLFALYISILALAFFLVFLIIGLIIFRDLDTVLKLSYQTATLVIALIAGTPYAMLRLKGHEGKRDDNSGYDATSKLLHNIALGSRAAKEIAFDIDCALNRSGKSENQPPVFVAGLARAGTTVLLEALYGTGEFSTLTYRDMPFVTAPYIWSKLAKGQKDMDKKERAHGDRLLVDFDSPEAFEEVFWLTFSDPTYIKGPTLEPHKADIELIGKYRKYVSNILARTESKKLRYLAKNNNNLLRIPALKAAFKDSVVLVPFRNPLDQAKSLLIQHTRFLETHSADTFSLKYMNWLGHFEFGANMKPFNLGPDAMPRSKDEPLELDYWLRYWGVVYDYIINNHKDEVVFFDYDKLCEHPTESLNRLGEHIGLDKALMDKAAEAIKPAKKHLSETKMAQLPPQIRTIHDLLKELAI